jgi:hypothetical protein
VTPAPRPGAPGIAIITVRELVDRLDAKIKT